jgi:BON domain
MKKILVSLFSTLLMVYASQGQQATPAPSQAAADSTGKNVKIIAREGHVRLKGPVDSQQEKDSIAAKAGEIAGKGKVDNQLEVKAGKK